MCKKKRKVILLVDNCSAHPKESADRLNNVRLEFLSPNTTSVIQPCDQGIIRNVKGKYRSEIVKKSSVISTKKPLQPMTLPNNSLSWIPFTFLTRHGNQSPAAPLRIVLGRPDSATTSAKIGKRKRTTELQRVDSRGF